MEKKGGGLRREWKETRNALQHHAARAVRAGVEGAPTWAPLHGSAGVCGSLGPLDCGTDAARGNAVVGGGAALSGVVQVSRSRAPVTWRAAERAEARAVCKRAPNAKSIAGRRREDAVESGRRRSPCLAAKTFDSR